MKGRHLHTEWKKPAALLLSFLFLFSSFGLTLYARDCSCPITTFSFAAKNKCGCTYSKPGNDCCKEMACFIKIKSKYFATQAPDPNLSKYMFSPSSFVVIDDFLYSNIAKQQSFSRFDNSRPLLPVQLFIFDRSILI